MENITTGFKHQGSHSALAAQVRVCAKGLVQWAVRALSLVTGILVVVVVVCVCSRAGASLCVLPVREVGALSPWNLLGGVYVCVCAHTYTLAQVRLCVFCPWMCACACGCTQSLCFWWSHVVVFCEPVYVSACVCTSMYLCAHGEGPLLVGSGVRHSCTLWGRAPGHSLHFQNCRGETCSLGSRWFGGPASFRGLSGAGM